jgi:hypothetical protein
MLRRLAASLGGGGGIAGVPSGTVLRVIHALSWRQANLEPGRDALRAQQLLDHLVQRHRTSAPRADQGGDDGVEDPAILMQGYHFVLEAWSKSGDVDSARRAQALLDQMKLLNGTLAASDRDARRVLDAETYSNAVLAWSKSGEQGSHTRSLKLLREMVDLHAAGAFPDGSEPPLIAFNGAISACVSTSYPMQCRTTP